MKRKQIRILLILIAVVCFGVALSYPITELLQEKQTEQTMDMLAALRNAGLENARNATEAPKQETPATDAPMADPLEPDVPDVQVTAQQPATAGATDAPGQPVATAAVASASGETEKPATDVPGEVAAVSLTQAPAAGEQSGEAIETAEPAADGSTPLPTVTLTPEPTATPNRWVNTGVKSWPDLEKVAFDEAKILPQYSELYGLNKELVGWLSLPGTKIDYPVMQREGDEDYYLSHDFFHKDNANGLLILDQHCDPYTPSYNLVVSGHNRKNGTMFSDISEYYKDRRHWAAHPYLQFDSVMEERTYLVFAAFFSADYDEDEEGFRYNADIQYVVDFNQWIREVNKYKLYDTGVDVKFGDELLTLTTCNSTKRKNGRFVVVCRRLREGEELPKPQ